ncbi:MAG: hypothetical protein U0270_16100 [Labilithrix sp.]
MTVRGAVQSRVEPRAVAFLLLGLSLVTGKYSLYDPIVAARRHEETGALWAKGTIHDLGYDV